MLSFGLQRHEVQSILHGYSPPQRHEVQSNFQSKFVMAAPKAHVDVDFALPKLRPKIKTPSYFSFGLPKEKLFPFTSLGIRPRSENE